MNSANVTLSLVTTLAGVVVVVEHAANVSLNSVIVASWLSQTECVCPELLL